jgi:DNA-directed RNA polymerase subunit RPC12/RpoP
MSEQYFSSLPKEIEEIQKEFAYAIYTHFSLLAVDLRHTVLPASWFKIFSDVEDYGYRRAVRMNSTVLDQCKNCDEVYEETGQEQEKPILRCSRCGSNEFIKKRRSYTSKHVHNIHSKILKKAEDLIEYWHLLDNFIKKIAHDITNNPELKQVLLRRFQEYELQARKDLLVKREYYCIEHYDPTRKCKKRPCNISENKLACVEINDERYHLQYKPLIEQALNTTTSYEKVNLLAKSTGLLQKLGWPESLIKDKIVVDIKRAYSLNYVQQR